MTEKKAAAKQALRSLQGVLSKSLDPNVVIEFFAEKLITDLEKQNIDAKPTNFARINHLLDVLRRRDNDEKVMSVLIQFLEGEDGVDKETNEKILKRVEKEYRFYSYETVLETDNDNPPKVFQQQPQVVGAVPPLPKLNIGGGYEDKRDLSLGSLTIVQEAVDGGGGRRDSYSMDTIPRGCCVIINNENFVNMKARAGSYWDADALEELFKKHLGFHVKAFKDLTRQQITHLMEDICKEDHSRLKCLVVCILSHGVDGQIYGTDGKLIEVQRITRTFTGTNCPSLAGKPKVFIIQACRGGSFDHGVGVEQTDDGETKTTVDEDLVLGEDETDGGGYGIALPDEADFLLAYATTPGFVSWRNSAFGTWYVRAFTETMYERAGQDHLMDILTEVNRKVAEEYESRGKKKQMPAPVTMLRYKLYLTPVGTKV